MTKALIIGLDLPDRVQTNRAKRALGFTVVLPLQDSLNEIKELARTAGLTIVGELTQKRDTPDTVSYVGSGKLEELKLLATETQTELIITDDELTPSQHKTLERELQLKVIDRTGLILDIFAMRARTHEAQLQVELAQLEYMMPRLTGLWTHLSRQTGGIGTRGPGETQLEVDKRRIKERVILLKDKLEKVKSHRTTQRAQRERLPVVVGAIIGYTNAGKSTLLNALTGADVLAEDKLFATLDPTTKRMELRGYDLLLTDTVGFIQKLPHHLVSSFRSTLEEVAQADFILHVVDISSPFFKKLIQTSQEIIKMLGADQIPQLYVFNKADRIPQHEILEHLASPYTPHVMVSALKKEGLDKLILEIESLINPLYEVKSFYIPYTRMDVVNQIHRHGVVLEETYEDQIIIQARLNKVMSEKIMGMLQSPSS